MGCGMKEPECRDGLSGWRMHSYVELWLDGHPLSTPTAVKLHPEASILLPREQPGFHPVPADLYPRSQAATENSHTVCQYLRGACPKPHGLTLLLSEEPRFSPEENGVHTKSHGRACHSRSPICPKFLLFISLVAPFRCKTKLRTGWGASTGVGS